MHHPIGPLTFAYYHFGGVPRYLRASIESVRFFNPDARIILTCDSEPRFPKEWNVEVYPLERFASPALEAFRKAYQHISTFKEKYERFVLERWFLFEEMRQSLGLGACVVLDSDVVVFDAIAPIFDLIPDCDFAMCGWCPGFTLVRRTMQGFLDHIMGRYNDPEYLQQARKRFAEARSRGELKNLGEMEFVREHLTSEQSGYSYPRKLPKGYMDLNLHNPYGLEFIQTRRRQRVKIFWRFSAGLYLPNVKEIGSETLVPAVCLHFQGPSKRLIFRFNKTNHIYRFPRSWKCALLNWLFNRTLTTH